MFFRKALRTGAHSIRARQLTTKAFRQPLKCRITALHCATDESKGPYVLRGDHRSPMQLKAENGFRPGNDNSSLHYHITKDVIDAKVIPRVFKPSGYVSVTTSYDMALFFIYKTGGSDRTMYRMLRPKIHVAANLNFTGEMRSCSTEFELSATGPIPYNEIFQYKPGTDIHGWTRNPDYKMDRDYSIGILSKDNDEALRFSGVIPPGHTLPSYSTAVAAAEILDKLSTQYTYNPSYMICFDALEQRLVEKVLGRSPGSGFSESDLPTYYAKHYEELHKQEGRVKKVVSVYGAGTLFSVPKSIEANSASQELNLKYKP